VKHRSNDWIVGLTIILTMVGIVAATLFLQQAELGRRREEVTARFRDIGSLQVGNAVVIRGVASGRVKQITLAPKGWVVVDMELDEGTVLPTDPVVLLQASSLFGEWQAMITPRTAVPVNRDVVAQVEDATDAPSGSLPGAVLPDIAQLTTVAGGIAGNVASVAERVRTAFNDTAAKELRASIRNFSVLSGDLARAVRAQSQNLDSLALVARLGLADVAASSAALRRTMQRVDTATASGALTDILGESRTASRNLREATDRLQRLAQSLEASEANLRGAIGKADTLLGRIERGQGSVGLLINDPGLYRNADSLLVELRALMADVRKDPKRYFSVRVF
jgi:phospholipid/cholesterol/gamma-HCH transport system substrate-binding protein